MLVDAAHAVDRDVLHQQIGLDAGPRRRPTAGGSSTSGSVTGSNMVLPSRRCSPCRKLTRPCPTTSPPRRSTRASATATLPLVGGEPLHQIAPGRRARRSASGRAGSCCATWRSRSRRRRPPPPVTGYPGPRPAARRPARRAGRRGGDRRRRRIRRRRGDPRGSRGRRRALPPAGVPRRGGGGAQHRPGGRDPRPRRVLDSDCMPHAGLARPTAAALRRPRAGRHRAADRRAGTRAA